MEDFAELNLEFVNQTTLHPLGFVAVMILGIAMLVVKRRSAVLPMIIMASFVAPAQRVVVGELDFNLLRIMVLFGWARVLLWQETRSFVWKHLDFVMILWVLYKTLAYTFLFGSFNALVLRLGTSFDAVGMYFLFRCLVQSWADVQRIIWSFAIVSVPVAIAFTFEAMTQRNVFAVFGGVPDLTVLRQGRLRCQGAFAHPIMAGCFWASLIPLFAAGWWAQHRTKTWSLVGLFCSSVIVILCASSTPVMTVFFGVIGWACFRLRFKMRWIRWGIALSLISLHLVMKAPVWHLIARMNIVGGSTGWHRYHLIDQCINRFSEWALWGTKSTAHWGWGLWDVTNQYVWEGVNGGVITLGLFLMIIVIAFRNVGQIWRNQARHRSSTVVAWALGVCLFVHCMNYIAVSYFGQIIIVWYLLLAMIASAAPAYRTRVSPSAIQGIRPIGSAKHVRSTKVQQTPSPPV